MRNVLAIVALLGLTAGLARADAVDEAEAKRRGVSVEAVQLEAAKARLALLEKQVKTLETQLLGAKAEVAASQTAAQAAATRAEDLAAQLLKLRPPTPPTTLPDPIALALQEHRILRGMTLDQLKKAIPWQWDKVMESNGKDYYKCGQSLEFGPLAEATLEGGRVISYEIKSYYLATLLRNAEAKK